MSKYFKKALALLLVVIICSSSISSIASATSTKTLVESGQCGANAYWAYYDDGSLEISGSGNMYGFNGVPSPWPEDITSVEIKDGITNISSHSFDAYSGLKSLTMADSVTIIEEGAFWGCSGLSTIKFSSSLTEVSSFAFKYCRSLDNIVFPASLKTVGSTAFENCNNLKSVTFEGKNINILDSAFRLCSSLKTIYFQNPEVDAIQYCAFSDTALTDIHYNGTQAQWNNVLMALECPNDEFINATIHLQESEAITSGNCSYDDGWSNVTWTLDDDGTLTISGRGYTRDYEIDADNHAPWLTPVFNNRTNSYDVTNTTIKKVIVEEGVESIGHAYFVGLQEAESISLPKTLCQFMGIFNCPKLTTLNIPSSLWDFSGFGITNCPSLKKVDIDKNNTLFFTDETGSLYYSRYGLNDETQLFSCLAGANGFSTYTIPDFVNVIWADIAFEANSFPIKLVSDNPELNVFNWLPKETITAVECYPFSEIYFAAKQSGIPVIPKSGITITKRELIYMPSHIFEVDQSCAAGSPKIAVTYSDGKTATVDNFMYTTTADTSTPGKKTAIMTVDGYDFSYEIEVHDKRQLTENQKYTADIDCDGENFYFTPSKTGEYEFDIILDKITNCNIFLEKYGLTDWGEYAYIDVTTINPEDEYPEIYFTADVVAGENYRIKIWYYEEKTSVDVAFRPVCDHSNAREFSATLPTCTTDGYMAGTYCSNCDKWISGHDIIKAFHWDKDEDGLCDTCSVTVTDSITTGKMTSAFLKKNQMIYFEFTPDETARYEFRALTLDDVASILDENMEQIRYIGLTESMNGGLNHVFEAGKTYYVGLGSSPEEFGYTDVKLVLKNDDDDDDEYHELTYKYGSISSNQTLELEFDVVNTLWLLEFTPEETGAYSFYASSGGCDTYGYIYNADMETIASNDDYYDCDFKATAELTAGETYYLGARYLSDYETGSFEVTLKKALPCDLNDEHSFTSYVYNNDATEYLDGTKTAYCDYGCENSHTVTAIGTALAPTIIELEPFKKVTVTLKPNTGVIFKINSKHNASDGNKYWVEHCYDKELTDELITKFYYDINSYGALNGSMYKSASWGHVESPVSNQAGHVYYYSLFSPLTEEITYSIKLLIESHTHDYKYKETIPPRCSSMGYDIYECECGETKIENYVPETGNCDYVVKSVTEPCCVYEGSTYYECVDCGSGYEDDFVPATGVHSFYETSDNNATCYSDATVSKGCHYCDYSETVTLPDSKVPHKFTDYYESNGSKIAECAYGCGTTDIIDASTITISDYSYYVSDSKVTITDYIGMDSVVVIPETIAGYPVNEIKSTLFDSDDGITKVTIPASVTLIEDNTFAYCYELTEIAVNPDNNNYSSDDNGVLYNKDKTLLITYPKAIEAETYVIADTVKTIGEKAFVFCQNIQTVTIPDSVESIGKSAFNYCGNLRNVSLGSNVAYIGSNAFGGCGNLNDMTFPQSLKEIGYGAFKFCYSIQNVIIPDSVTKIGEFAFEGCAAINLIIGKGLKTIEWGSFACPIHEIVIPTNVEKIERYAFGDNTITHLCYEGTLTQWNNIDIAYSNEPLYNAIYFHTEYVPETITVTQEPTCTTTGYTRTSCSCGMIKSNELLMTTDHTFTNYISDNNATCTENGTKTAECIHGCSTKDTITIEGSATGHNYVVQDNGTNHSHTTLYKCSYCEDEKTETIDVSYCVECNFEISQIDSNSYKLVSYIGNESNVIVPATYKTYAVTTIAASCFKDNTSITAVTICDGVTSIESLAFANCTSLKKVTIPASVTSIGEQAFYGFTGTIYCTNGSAAHKYAVANNINYVLITITETQNTQIDYDNFVIRTTVQSADEITEVLGVSENASVTPTASYVHGDLELYGTGSVITVYDGNNFVGNFTLIVEGDTNGDSICDVLDIVDVERASNNNAQLSGAYALAADNNLDNVVDTNDYQAIVNKALA